MTSEKKSSEKTLNITNKCLSKNEWESIEEKVDDNFKKISSSMVEFSDKIFINGIYNFELLSNNNFQIPNFDLLLFNLFIEKFKKIIPKEIKFTIYSKDFGSVKESDIDNKDDNEIKKKNNKTKNKKVNSGQQMKDNIRLKNFLKKIDDDITSLDETSFTNFSDKSYNLIESKLLNYLVYFFKILKKKIELKKENPPELIFLLNDCILSIARCINYFKTNYSNFSKLILEQSEIVLKFCETLINIEEFEINYPELITQTTFDKQDNKCKIKLYKCQEEVLVNLNNSMKNDIPLFINYQTPPGAGKTTLVVSVASLGAKYDKQVIYVCYNEIVRNEVSKMCFHSGITFAIISDCIIKPHNSCFTSKKNRGKIAEHEDRQMRLNYELVRIKTKCDKIPLIYVCDLLSASILLNTKESENKYICYIDEPTAGAETENSEMTINYMKIILNCSKTCICLSATMPENEETPFIYNNFKKKFNADDTNIKIIKSSLIPINCLILDENAFIVCPHDLANNIEELKTIIDFLEKKPFLLKFYTPYTYYSIKNILKSNNIIVEEEKFSLLDISHKRIRTETLKLLKILVKENLIDIFNEIKAKKNKIAEKGFDYKTCCTKTAFQHLGQTLIIQSVEKCHDLVLRNCNDILRENNNIKLQKLIEEYDKKNNDYMKKKQEIEKGTNTKGHIENMIELSTLEVPVFNWNYQLTVNSVEHIKKYNNIDKTEFKKYSKLLKHPAFIQGLELNILKEFPDYYDSATLMGVGVIDPYSDLLKSNGNIYNNEILKLASQASLSFITSNKSISYGTNLPIQKIVIENVSQSQNTLHQQLGRVGRLGKSLNGIVILQDKELIDLAFTPIKINIEAQNINTICYNILNNS